MILMNTEETCKQESRDEIDSGCVVFFLCFFLKKKEPPPPSSPAASACLTATVICNRTMLRLCSDGGEEEHFGGF